MIEAIAALLFMAQLTAASVATMLLAIALGYAAHYCWLYLYSIWQAIREPEPNMEAWGAWPMSEWKGEE